jgi:hypothetical protein
MPACRVGTTAFWRPGCCCCWSHQSWRLGCRPRLPVLVPPVLQHLSVSASRQASRPAWRVAGARLLPAAAAVAAGLAAAGLAAALLVLGQLPLTAVGCLATQTSRRCCRPRRWPASTQAPRPTPAGSDHPAAGCLALGAARQRRHAPSYRKKAQHKRAGHGVSCCSCMYPATRQYCQATTPSCCGNDGAHCCCCCCTAAACAQVCPCPTPSPCQRQLDVVVW